MSTIQQAASMPLRMVCALAIVAGTASAVQAATASWDPSSEPDLAGYKLSYGTQPGAHTVTIDVGKVITYPFNPAPGRYYVVVQAYNTTGELSEKSAEVMVDILAPNRPPTLAQPVNQNSTVNANVLLALSASDPDRTALSFSSIGLPPGLSLNGMSGIISGVALAKGAYQVTVTVSDGALSVSCTFSWTVIAAVSAPLVLDLSPLDTTLMLNDNNSSLAPWLMAQTRPAKGVAAAILMKFNLSQIPANATIQSAVLNLSLISVDEDTDPDYRISLHEIINRNPDITRATGRTADGVTAWTANQCCRGFSMAQSDISAARSATVINRTLGFKTWDAAAMARAWVASPASNRGLLLNPDANKGRDRFRTFASMQDPLVARRPFLRVTYTLPISGSQGGPSMLAAGSNVSGPAAVAAPPSEVIVENGVNQLSVDDPYLGVSGDFDGDGRADLATYQPSAGEWRIWNSGSKFATPVLVTWGIVGDIPMPADYDGDRIADLAIYRPSTGNWHLWLSRTKAARSVKWGDRGDRPLSLDHDGDGKADLALIRDGGYEILLSTTNYSTSVTVR